MFRPVGTSLDTLFHIYYYTRIGSSVSFNSSLPFPIQRGTVKLTSDKIHLYQESGKFH